MTFTNFLLIMIFTQLTITNILILKKEKEK